MEFKDYYATLEVPKTATDAEIKRAYRKLARKYHPDLNPGDKTAEAKFKEVNEAHEVLGDPDKRKKYDELGDNWRAYDQASPPGAETGGWSPFAGGAPGGGSYRTMTPEEVQEMFGDADPFSDFFHTFFGGAGRGGGRGSRRARPRRGRDVESAVDLTLEEAFAGTTRRVAYTHDGQTRTIDVRIPAGVNDGARVRATGEGEPAPAGGTAGDLFLGVRILPNSRFERRGQDLHMRIQVPVTTAVLGGEVPVETLGGSTLRLRVPELTRSGRVFRLRGHGMPRVGKPEERGDLFATVDIAVPTELTPEARRHYEALKALDATKAAAS